MIYTVPHYYSRFHCVAGECEDTCCAGWSIMIDDASLKKYKKQKDGFGNRLKNSIDWKEQTFKQYEKRCAFLNEDNLCDMYTEAGPAMLCKTCRNYPRHIEEFEGVREISLSLSCMEAAKLILGIEEKVTFLSKETEREESYDDFDFFLYTKLVDVRDLLLEIMQNRSLDSGLRMAVVLSLGHDLQRRIRDGKLYEVDQLLERYRRDDMPKIISKKISGYRIQDTERFHRMKKMVDSLNELEVLKEDWTVYVEDLRKELYGNGPEAYANSRRDFGEFIGKDEEFHKLWNRWCEQLMVYFLFTYFCGAVYDEHAYEKVKLAVYSTLVIQELAHGLWEKQNRSLSFHDFLELAHRYSREAEHSDLNLQKLEEMFIKDEQFGMKNLLGLTAY